ncbi:MAG: helix-turn-helix domain-containing protein [Nitrososphaerota archaeon]|nr:hypothetical protein [Candidatus Calditenuis fumarioli]
MCDDPYEEYGLDALGGLLVLLILLLAILVLIDAIVKEITKLLMSVKAMLDALVATLISAFMVVVIGALNAFVYLLVAVATLILGVQLYKRSDKIIGALSSLARWIAGHIHYRMIEPLLAIRELRSTLDRMSGDTSCLMVLMELLNGPAGSISELGERVGKRALSTVHTHIRHLVDCGLVERVEERITGRRGSSAEVRVGLARRFDRWTARLYLRWRIGRLLKAGERVAERQGLSSFH